jgi:hypothetical protein
MHFRPHEALLHNHEISASNQKTSERKANQKAIDKMRCENAAQKAILQP